MHLALIQLTNKHTEIFGTFLEYAIKNKFEITIYYNLQKDLYSFVPYYAYLFNRSFTIKAGNALLEDRDAIDIFLYASASDHNYVPEILKKLPYIDRSIFVQHQTTHIFPYMEKMVKVSPVIKSAKFADKQCEYILPIYKAYREIHYKKQDRTIFGIIGGIRGTKTGKILDRDITMIQEILEKYTYENYEIRFFMRKWDWIWLIGKVPMLKDHPKIKAFFGLDTPNLIKKLRKIKFILPLAKNNGWFYWQRLTGSIPLAINLNIPLLMDEKLAKIYNMQDMAVTYGSRLEEVFPNILYMGDEEYYEYVKKTVEYKIRVCRQNRNALKKLINYKYNAIENQLT